MIAVSVSQHGFVKNLIIEMIIEMIVVMIVVMIIKNCIHSILILTQTLKKWNV
jgi:hypothetical protein